jgi:hypothetical protein
VRDPLIVMRELEAQGRIPPDRMAQIQDVLDRMRVVPPPTEADNSAEMGDVASIATGGTNPADDMFEVNLGGEGRAE